MAEAVEAAVGMAAEPEAATGEEMAAAAEAVAALQVAVVVTTDVV